MSLLPVPRVKRRKRRLENVPLSGLIAALAAALALAACGSTAHSSAKSPKSTYQVTPTNVTLQVYPADMFSMPIFAAQDEGFFKKNGLDVTTVPTSTGPASIAALSSGSVDAVGVSPEVIFSLDPPRNCMK